MLIANIGILSFNGGEFTPQIDARSDVEKYASGCRHLENMIPLIYGPAERRPGTLYIESSKTAGAAARLISFIFSSTIAYKVEFGNLYLRFLYNDAYLENSYSAWAASTAYVLGDLVTESGSYYRCLVAHTSGTFSTDLTALKWEVTAGAADLAYEIPSPYLTADLFDIHDRQLGDTMWLVHESYAPRKLTRTTATVFSLDTIAFEKGPFLTRQDLIDPDESSTTSMVTNAVTVDGTGTLVCASEDGAEHVPFFTSDHVGAIIKLVHARTNTIEKGELTNATTGIMGDNFGSAGVDVKGTFHFTTHKTWEGTIVLERNENDAGWEAFRTYVSEDDRNIQYAGTEEADNVKYRINLTSHTSGKVRADITIDESTQTGIVRIDSIISASEAGITVLSKLASKTITGISKADPCVVTCVDHRLVDGDRIMISGVVGMTEVDGIYSVGTIVDADTFQLRNYEDDANIDSSGFSTWTSGGIITEFTRRWAEGAWSAEKGYPSSITFFENRCVYGGQSIIPKQIVIPDLYDYQVTNDGNYASAQSTNWYAQTFTASASYHITHVELELTTYAADETRSITISIRETSGGLPTGDDLATATIVATSLSGYIPTFRIAALSTGISLTSGTVYAIVIRELANDGLRWFANSNVVDPYAGGMTCISQNSGVDWIEWDINDYGDFSFKTKGYLTEAEASLTEAKQLVVWPSKTGDYDNFAEGVLDDDSWVAIVPTTNDCRWVESLEALLIGTSGDVWRMASNKLDTALTPTNYTIKQQSSHGSNKIQPVKVNEVILFVDYVGRKVRELTYRDYPENKYVAPDLTSLAEHITSGKIVSIAHQKNPDSILWCVLDDGELISMTYERKENVVGWAVHPIDGDVKSVCVVPSTSEDYVWLTIERTINSNTVSYIERMNSRTFTDIEDAIFVDSGLTTTAPAASITLAHLIGETVAILGDGVVMDTAVVGGGGTTAVKLAGVATNATVVQAGLAYTYKLEPMRPDVQTQGGTTHGSIVKVPEMGISFLNTMNAKYGTSDTKLYDIDWDNVRWTNNTEITDLFTGDVIVSVDGGFSLDNPLIISGSDPLPCTVRALIPKMEKTGR